MTRQFTFGFRKSAIAEQISVIEGPKLGIDKEIGLEQIASAIKHNNNVVDFTEFTLKVVKEA